LKETGGTSTLVPAGGATGQVLAKTSGTDYATGWTSVIPADGSVTSAKIVDGTIVDADISASAAIATSKVSGLDSALAGKAPIASPTFTGTTTDAALSVTGGAEMNTGLASITRVQTNGQSLSTAGETATLQVRSNSTGDAYVTFHNYGRYAANFGLDASTNDLAYGGWSVGAAKYKVFHALNSTAPYRMAAGTAANAAGAYATVTFPASRFNVAPIVTISEASTGGHVVVPYIPGNISSTGFTVAGYTLGGANVATTFHWHAVQMTSGAAAG